MESTAVRWKNGEVLYVVSERLGSHGSKIELYQSNKLIHSFASTLGLASAIVLDNTLYIFGVSDWSRKNEVMMISSNDLKSFSEPVVVLRAKEGQIIFNNSVAKDKAGGYIMAYEVCEPNIKCFSARFATSKNLLDWKPIGNLMKTNEYAACPTIRYIDGYYYVFYLKVKKSIFSTYIARTTDFIHFQESQIPVVTPTLEDEGTNTSDMDLVETDKQVIFTYAVGNQKSAPLGWAHIKSGHFDGNLSKFVSTFFYSDRYLRFTENRTQR